MSLKPVLKILYPPSELKCAELYSIQDYYDVCISQDRTLLVYDKALLGKTYGEIEKQAEEYLKGVLTLGEKDLSKIVERADPKIKHILERQLFGYGVLEPFFIDENIIDVHILVGKPIKVVHRKYGDLLTNVILNEDELREIVMRMSTLAGKVISEATPLASFIEPRYETRVSVIYISDVTMRKSMTVDIRKQPRKPWSILKLVDMGTMSIEEAAFLWLAIKYKVPVMIVGEMMSGKTTIATAILNLIPPYSRVMTIEDAPEIRLCTPYWTRTTTRESAENPVSVFSLLKVALRLSVDYVVVGEVRGEEARDWAQAILLGHGAVTTFHADSPESALLRLTTPPISVNPQALRLLNVFVRTIPMRKEEKLVRRTEVYIYDIDPETGNQVLTPLFIYDPNSDVIHRNNSIENPVRRFLFFKRVALAHGVTIDQLEQEYNAMVKIMESIYNEAKAKDPSLEQPDVCELAEIAYKMLGSTK